MRNTKLKILKLSISCPHNTQHFSYVLSGNKNTAHGQKVRKLKHLRHAIKLITNDIRKEAIYDIDSSDLGGKLLEKTSYEYLLLLI